MRKSAVQMSFCDIYNGVTESMERKKPELVRLLEEHLNFDELIPEHFRSAFYSRLGRGHIYHLESLIRALILETLLGIPTDALLITVLQCSAELRDFCGFTKVPDASQFTRFRKNYCDFLAELFERLVEITEPICRKIDSKKADYLIYDTTGIELKVAENNPKFLNTKLKEAKTISKSDPGFDPYRGVYALLPDCAKSNSDARQQYVNGHFCYAAKAGVLTNGLGIPRHIAFFDGDFRKKHPELNLSKSESPESDKEIGDSTSLKPVLSDFFSAHPSFSYKTFIGDSAFDSYDTYTMLRKKFHFRRACIPLNPRNSKSSDVTLNPSGTPICPADGSPFIFLGRSGGKGRSLRFKWVCSKSVRKGSTRRCVCEHPCTDSTYGKCVYTYPDRDFRICPGIQRGTEHWDNLYRNRVVIERSFNLMKNAFALDSKRSLRTVSAKADLFLAGIVQLLGVLLADALHDLRHFRSIRKLIA